MDKESHTYSYVGGYWEAFLLILAHHPKFLNHFPRILVYPIYHSHIICICICICYNHYLR
ncbi:hypothetical protein Lalb_Chr07g0184061 [Lupinus albus]|uniref:Uncharacterized protein n=1 Tax=Lupinus albus TaxID=3870 RepID=A0A6A4Q8U1_LUPAL|nr:hypothetical protein Lalb_Chr07g0184061 [Lupinus albus]